MKNNKIISEIQSYLKPLEKEFGLEVVDIEYVKEGPNYYLRIFIDKDGGVDIIDCEKLSRALDVILEEKDPIKDSYILEVSSPGIDRPLKKDSDYEKFKGEIIDIKLYKSIDKQKEFQGELVGLIDNKVKILIDNEILEFPLEDIAVCRLAVIF